MFILGWGHRTEFKDRGGDTAQKDRTDVKDRGGHRTSAAGGWPGGWPGGWVAGWVGGRVGGRVVFQGNNATLWLHLASWNLPDSQLS